MSVVRLSQVSSFPLRLALSALALSALGGCELTTTSGTPDARAVRRDVGVQIDVPAVPDVPEVCLGGVGTPGAAAGRSSGALSGIRCSASTCMCTGLHDSGSGSSWRAWWPATFQSAAPDGSGYVNVLSSTCDPAIDQCGFRLEFGGNNFYANTDVLFADGSLSTAERAGTYVNMTSVVCSGDTFNCVGELQGGGVAVWDVGVAAR